MKNYSFIYNSVVENSKLLFYVLFFYVFLYMFFLLRFSSADSALHSIIIEFVNEINPNLAVFFETQKFYTYNFSNYYFYYITVFIHILKTCAINFFVLYFFIPKNIDIQKKEKLRGREFLKFFRFCLKVFLHFTEKNLLKFIIFIVIFIDIVDTIILKYAMTVKFKDIVYSYSESQHIIQDIIFKNIVLIFLKVLCFSSLYYKKNRKFIYRNNFKFLIYFLIISLLSILSFFILNFVNTTQNEFLNIVVKKIIFIFVASLTILLFKIIYKSDVEYIKYIIIIQLILFIFLLSFGNIIIFNKYVNFIFFIDVVLIADLALLYKDKIKSIFK
jgi:hypothetical protein